MNSRLFANLIKHPDPRELPPPDPQCRSYDYAQTMLLLRNHERSKQQSEQLHQPRKPQ